jgi:hypothetical protein
MKSPWLPAVLAALLAGPAAHAATLVHAGSLIDGRADRAARGRPPMVVEEGRITRRRARPPRAGPGDLVIDLRDSTVLPGLMDMHTHLSRNLGPTSYILRFTLNAPQVTRYRRRCQCAAHSGSRLYHRPGSRRPPQCDDGLARRHCARRRRRARAFSPPASPSPLPADTPTLPAAGHAALPATRDRRRRHQRRRRSPQGGAAALQGRRGSDQGDGHRRRAQPGGKRREPSVHSR